MIINILLILLGFFLLIKGADFLVEGSSDIAKRFHMSDSYVHEVFDRYVKMDRLPLTDAISIDGVTENWLNSVPLNCKNPYHHSFPMKSTCFKNTDG